MHKILEPPTFGFLFSEVTFMARFWVMPSQFCFMSRRSLCRLWPLFLAYTLWSFMAEGEISNWATLNLIGTVKKSVKAHFLQKFIEV